MRAIWISTALALMVAPVWADDAATTSTATITTTTTTTSAVSSGPQEVGSTTMPAGQYYITEQNSHKCYSLTVTDKGNMILGQAPDGLEIKMPGATTTAATPGSPASLLTTGKGLGKGLMKQGMEKGMSELVKEGATKELGNMMK